MLLGYLCWFNNGTEVGNGLEEEDCLRFQYQICLSIPLQGFISSLVPSMLICRHRFVLRCRNVLSCNMHTIKNINSDSLNVATT